MSTVNSTMGGVSAIKERPILFSAAMVRAILAGKKTQTRRIVNPQPIEHDFGVGGVRFAFVPPQTKPGYEAVGCHVIKNGDTVYLKTLPYGIAGDRLWVRETWCPTIHGSYEPFERTRKSPKSGLEAFIQYRAEYPGGSSDTYDGFWRPSIFMPRWASRITLEVTGLRVERLQDITERDALAEGCEPWPFGAEQTMTTGEIGAVSPYRGGYAVLWDEINDERATWKSNPWVWVVTFRRADAALGVR